MWYPKLMKTSDPKNESFNRLSELFGMCSELEFHKGNYWIHLTDSPVLTKVFRIDHTFFVFFLPLFSFIIANMVVAAPISFKLNIVCIPLNSILLYFVRYKLLQINLTKLIWPCISGFCTVLLSYFPTVEYHTMYS